MNETLILFSLAARRGLRQRTTRASATCPGALGATMQNIETILQSVFPDVPTGGAIIVQDLYSSYRPRDGEFILLVERAEPQTHQGLYVVKIGDVERLTAEWNGWNCCRPDGIRHDLVLTTLEPRFDGDRLIALVYADAEQFIGVDQTLSLEAALLESTRLGVPTAESVADVLFYLYERLGLLLYSHSYTDLPTTPTIPFTAERLDRRIRANLEACANPRGPVFDTRAVAISASFDAGLSDRFLDPYRFALAVLNDPGDCVPRLLRGYGHGDLHGRNVLVGRVGDRVLWPAVFDYGDMGMDNLIGWDFVKMETEFKIRAYPELFPVPAQAFVGEVIRMEHDLHTLTEEYRNNNQWSLKPVNATSPVERFRWLVLMMRKQASQQMGLYRNRSREWLAEYYFLLAIYGLNGMRFENLTDMQRLGAYLSAGCAASRYVWDRNLTHESGESA